MHFRISIYSVILVSCHSSLCATITTAELLEVKARFNHGMTGGCGEDSLEIGTLFLPHFDLPDLRNPTVL
jgi:hypothetical protein